MDVFTEKPRLAYLLDHFSKIRDSRQSCKVMYPLQEVLFLVVCGTIASSDDYEDIVDWGEAHLDFLRQFLEFHYGIPCADWLRNIMNHIDPDLFSACFSAWVEQMWPEKRDQIAIDGKTSRRSHDKGNGKRALHLVSAFATSSRLVLGQQAVDEKSNEITAIPALLKRIDAKDALVSIDAMGCNPNTAEAILETGADYLLALKKNQPTLYADAKSYFKTAPYDEVEHFETIDKGHGRIETRIHQVSLDTDWFSSDRAYPRAPRFPGLKSIAMVEARIEHKNYCSQEWRYYISSRPLSAQEFALAARSHWQIENNLHWMLDVTFKEDLSRLRKGYGAKNMSVVRHFALNLVRQIDDRLSIKRRRKRASYDTDYLHKILQPTSC
jgi:predicted transposase YbfD/YdcC